MAAPVCVATQRQSNVRTTPLVRPPVALTIDIFARILAEIGRADDEELEALGPGLVASPCAWWDAHRIPFLELDDLVVDFHPPAPAQDHVHLLLLHVRVAVRKAIAGRDALVAQGGFLELERLGRRAELQIRRAVEPRADVLQIRLDVPERERHGAILWRHPGNTGACRRRNCQRARSSGGRVRSDNRTRVGPVTLQRMDNVGIVVESLDAAISFFAELGLELEGRATIEGEWAGRVTGLGDQRVEIAMMRTPDGHSRLELSRFLTPPVVADHRNAPVNALGYLRVMFAVDDIDETLERLRKRGAQLVGEVVRYKDAYRLCYIRGPEGILIGLAQDLQAR